MSSKKSKKRTKRRRTSGARARRPEKKPKAVIHADYLTLLGKAAKHRSRRKALIDFANTNELHAIIECIENVLAGNVALTPAQHKKLKRYKTIMRTMTTRQLSPVQLKRHLNQSGGFLGSFIPIALSAVWPMFQKLLPKIIPALRKL